MSRNQKQDSLKEVAQHIWSMHQQTMENRSKLENRLNYFLAIDALLLLVFLQLFQSEVKSLSLLFVIPCTFLILPILLLLANFFARPLLGPWMDFDDPKKSLTEIIDKDEFYIEWIADIYSCTEGSNEYRKRIVKLLRLCVGCVAISLVWLVFLLLNSISCMRLDVCVIAVLFALLVFVIAAITRVLMRNCKEFPYKGRRVEVKRSLEAWLNCGAVDQQQ
jgi:hypothetical protein